MKSVRSSHSRVFELRPFLVILSLIALLFSMTITFPRPAVADPTADPSSPLQLHQTVAANEYIDTTGGEFSYTFAPFTVSPPYTYEAIQEFMETARALEDPLSNKLNREIIVWGNRLDKYPPMSSSVSVGSMESGQIYQEETVGITIPPYCEKEDDLCKPNNASDYLVYEVSADQVSHAGHDVYVSKARYYVLINGWNWEQVGPENLTADDIIIVKVEDDWGNPVDYEIVDELAFTHRYLDTVATQIDFATENQALTANSVVPMMLVITPPENYYALSPDEQYVQQIYASAAYGVDAEVTGTGSLAIGENTAVYGNYSIAFGDGAYATGDNSIAYYGTTGGNAHELADNGGLHVDYTVAVPINQALYNHPYYYPGDQATGTLCSESDAAQAVGLTGYANNAYCVLYYAKNDAGGGPVFTNIPVGSTYELFTYPGYFEIPDNDIHLMPSPPSLTNFPDEIWLATYADPADQQSVIEHWDTPGWTSEPFGGVVRNFSTPIYIRDYAAYYSLYFDGNGADGGSTEAIIDKLEGTEVSLTPNGFTRDGYTFQGWATSPERANAGTVDYADEAAFTFPATDTTLYAVWEEVPPPFDPPVTAAKESQGFTLNLGVIGGLLGAVAGLKIARRRYAYR